MFKTLTQDLIHLTLGKTVFLVSGYLVHFFLARSLGVENYGLFGIVASILTLLNIFIASAFPKALSKFIASEAQRADEIKKTTLKLQTFSSLFLALLLIFFSRFLADFVFEDKRLEPLLTLAAFSLPVYALYTFVVGYYNGLRKFKHQAVLNISYSLVKLVAVLILTFLFFLEGAIIGFFVAAFLVGAVSGIKMVSLKKEIKEYPKKPIIEFAFPVGLFALLLNLMFFLDIFLVKIFVRDNFETGLYTAALNLSRFPYFLFEGLALILLPHVAYHRSRLDLKKIIIAIFVFVIPSISVLSIFSRSLIRFFYSDLYLEAAGLLSLLTLATGSISLFFIISTILNGLGEVKKPLYLVFFGIICQLFLSLVLVARASLTGLALSKALAGSILVVLSSIQLAKRYPFHEK